MPQPRATRTNPVLQAVPTLAPAAGSAEREAMLTSWARHMRARNLSTRTVNIYLGAARRLDAFLIENGHRGGWDSVARDTLETYIGQLVETRSGGYASNQYRALQQL